MHSEGKLVTGSMIIEKAKSFFDEMQSAHSLRAGCEN